MKNVRNPAMARLKGTSGNSKGEHFFDLLSDRPWVRIPPGSPKIRKPFMGFRIFVILMGIRTHGRRPGANEGSASTVWSAEGKRPEFVSAKRVQTPLQGVCTTIERTDESRRAHQRRGTEKCLFSLCFNVHSDFANFVDLTRLYRFGTY